MHEATPFQTKKTNESSRGSEITSEQVQRLVDQLYHAVIEGRHHDDGTGIWHPFEDLEYSLSATQRSGKQQPVFFLHIRFPDGTIKTVVCKSDWKHMHAHQQASATLQRLFPRIYFETNKVAAIEPIRGLENDSFRDFFMRHPRLIPALAQESIKLNDQLLDAGWQLVDIKFCNGHNVMLDASARLRLFDIHSIVPLTRARESAVLDFFQRQFPVIQPTESLTPSEERRYELLVYSQQVRAYLERHGGFPHVTATHRTTLYGEHPRYPQAFAEVAKTVDPDEIFFIDEATTGVETLDPRIVEACLNGDVESLNRFYRENDNHVTSFVGPTTVQYTS